MRNKTSDYDTIKVAEKRTKLENNMKYCNIKRCKIFHECCKIQVKGKGVKCINYIK